MKLKSRFLRSSWISIWTNPRKTVQNLLNSTSEIKCILLFMLSHITIVVYIVYYGELITIPGNYEQVILKAILIGMIWGLYALYVDSKLIEILGKKIGGKASFSSIKKALALAQIPLIYGGILHGLKFIIKIILVYQFNFKFNGLEINNNNVILHLFFTFCFILDCIILFKSFVIYLNCLSEVQDFSKDKGLSMALKNTTSIFLGLMPILFLDKIIDKFF